MSNKNKARLMGARVVDFSGGMNNTIHPALLGETESALVQSLSLDEKGTLTPTRGRRLRYALPFSAEAVNGIARYVRSDGISRLLIGSGGSLFTDTPRLVTVFDSLEDWESGEPGETIDLTTEPGTMTVKEPGAGELEFSREVSLDEGSFYLMEYFAGDLFLTKMGVNFTYSLPSPLQVPVRVPAVELSPDLDEGSGSNYEVTGGVVSLSKVVS